MSEPKKPFIPAWLNQAGLSKSEFRVYCCLSCRADNSTGIAWPQADTIADDCGMAMNTVWATLKALEKRKLIARKPKPFGGSNRYSILLPTSAKEIPIDDSQPAQNYSHQSAQNTTHQSAQNYSREGTPSKVPQVKVPNSIGDSQQDGFNLSNEEKPLPTGKNQLAETIYSEYPRKESKPAAIKAILKAFKTYPPEHLLERTKAYAAAIAWKEKQFIPHPATWFNNERFEDDPIGWEQPNKTTNQQPRTVDTSARPGDYTEV
jgi:DNA-binding MarR family transcriptional regulator